MNAKGHVFKYPDNVDTDVIIPRPLSQHPGRQRAGFPLHGGHRQDLRAPGAARRRDGGRLELRLRLQPGARPPVHQDQRHLGGHRQELCPHFLPQQHQHRPCPSWSARRPPTPLRRGMWSAWTSTPASSPTRPPAPLSRPSPFPPFIQEIIAAGGLMNLHQGQKAVRGGSDMEKNIAVIWGDCASPEIVPAGRAGAGQGGPKSTATTFHYTDAAMGGEAIDKYGDPLPQHELDKCLAADSVLLGAGGRSQVGGPARGPAPRKGACCGCAPGWACIPTAARPRSGPSWPPPAPSSPRSWPRASTSSSCGELTGGVYFGEHRTDTLPSGGKAGGGRDALFGARDRADRPHRL